MTAQTIKRIFITSRLFVRGLVAAFALLILSAALQPVSLDAQTSRPGTSAANVCSGLVQAALQSTDQRCSDTTRNQACYGNLLNVAIPREGVDSLVFEQQGDKANLFDVDRLELSALDATAERWGVVLMQVQANLPGSLPGQNVTFLLFGDTVIENDAQNLVDVAGTAQAASVIQLVPSAIALQVGTLAAGEVVSATAQHVDVAGQVWLRIRFEGTDNRTGWVPAESVDVAGAELPLVDAETINQQPMQAFYFRTGIGQPECVEAPRNGMLVQTPQGAGKVDFTVNGVDLKLGSTAFMTSTRPLPGEEGFGESEDPDTTCIVMFSGEAELGLGEDTTLIPSGERSCVEYDDEGNPAEITEPEKFDPREYGDLAPVLEELGIEMEEPTPTPTVFYGGVASTSTPTATPEPPVDVAPPTAEPTLTPVPLAASFDYDVEGWLVSLTNTSTGPVASLLWDFGDGTTSTEQNPVKDYQGQVARFSIDVTISLTVTGIDGQTSTRAATITLFGPLEVSFTAEPNGLLVTVSASVSGTFDRIRWNFGDGQNGTGEFTTHTYAAPGTYTITATAINANDTASASNTVTVDYGPLFADFTWVLQADGYTVQFTDTSGGSPDSWSWEFGDEFSGERSVSTDQNPSFTYEYSGTYDVMLTVSRGGTLTDTISYQVDVFGPLAADFGWSLNTATLEVQFYDYSGGQVTSWDWDFGDGNTSTLQNPVNPYAAPGTYDVILTVGDGVDTNTVTYSVEVGAVVAAFYYYDYGSGLVYFYDYSSGAVTSWDWDFGDGNTAPGSSVSHQYTGSGTYTVILTVSDGSNTDTESMSVTVAVPLAASFSHVETSGGEVQFTDTSLGAPTSWDWDFGDGTTSTAQNPTHTYATNGAYDVTLTVGDGTDTNVFMVCISVTTILPPLVADFTLTQTGADGLTVNFTDASTGSPDGWAWEFLDGATSLGTSAAQNPTFVFAQSDLTYTVTLAVTRSADSAADNVSNPFYAIPPVVADFSFSVDPATREVTFTNTSTGSPGSSFWQFGDGNTSVEMDPIYPYATYDVFPVNLQVSNGFSSDFIMKEVMVAICPYDFQAAAVLFVEVPFGSPTVAEIYGVDLGCAEVLKGTVNGFTSISFIAYTGQEFRAYEGGSLTETYFVPVGAGPFTWSFGVVTRDAQEPGDTPTQESPGSADPTPGPTATQEPTGELTGQTPGDGRIFNPGQDDPVLAPQPEPTAEPQAPSS